MAGFFAQVRDSFANQIRNAQLTPKELEERQKGKQALAMLKIASIVGFVASLVLFGLFPNLFTFILSTLAAFTGREIYCFSENLIEILDNATTEATARRSRDAFIEQAAKKTYLVKPILQLIGPKLNPFLFA